MKYTKSIVLVILMIAAAFFAYKYENSSKVVSTFENTDTPEVVFVKTVPESKVSTSTEGKYFSAKVDYPSNNDVVQSLALKDYYSFINDAPKDTDTNPDIIKYQYVSTYTYSTSSMYESYIYKNYEYTGGAHGMTNINTIVYKKNDINKVRVNSLADIYKDGVYKFLSDYARKELKNNKDYKDYYDENVVNSGTEPNQDNFSGFYFDNKDGLDYLNVIFGQYQVGPYVIGMPEISIKLSSLEQFVK